MPLFPQSIGPGVVFVLSLMNLTPFPPAARAQAAPARGPAAGQDSRLQRPAAELLAGVPPLAADPTVASGIELTIRWIVATTGAPNPPPGGVIVQSDQFDVVRRRSVEWGGVRERDPQLSPEELVIVALGADGGELGWQKIKDPRIVRAESPGLDGTLTGQILHRPLTEIVVTLPVGMPATALRVYETQWTGAEFVLQALGLVAVAP